MKIQILSVIIIIIIIPTEVSTQTIQLSELPSSCTIAIYWVDRRCEELRVKDAAIDTLFDSAVGIVMRQANVTRLGTGQRVRGRDVAVAAGLYITNRLILSSYNAFMTLAQRRDTLKRLGVYIILSRRFNDQGKILYYNIRFTRTTDLLCARQVMPYIKLEPLPDHMRHGIHSPLHDLMVLRINRQETFADPVPPRRFHFNDWKQQAVYDNDLKNYNWPMGPVQAKLARPGDVLGEDIRWASMGHINELHIRLYRFLELGKMTVGEKVVTDCDAWIPREWGHFICLFNKHNYPGLASGGILFSDGVVFGIGSFALFKGKHSILVFTDVRPYWHLLYQTCTDNDQNLIVPGNSTTSTTHPSTF